MKKLMHIGKIYPQFQLGNIETTFSNPHDQLLVSLNHTTIDDPRMGTAGVVVEGRLGFVAFIIWSTEKNVVFYRRKIMSTAVEDTKALVVTSQPQMLEKLLHSEVLYLFVKVYLFVKDYTMSSV